MRYKNDYKPQYILDPDTNTWDRLDEAYLAKLDQEGFVSLSRERGIGNAQLATTSPPPYPKNPKAAQNSKLCVMMLDLPGVMNVQDLEEQVDMASVIMQIGSEGNTQLAPAGVSFSQYLILPYADLVIGSGRMGQRQSDRCSLYQTSCR